jgi:hypothetical protein
MPLTRLLGSSQAPNTCSRPSSACYRVSSCQILDTVLSFSLIQAKGVSGTAQEFQLGEGVRRYYRVAPTSMTEFLEDINLQLFPLRALATPREAECDDRKLEVEYLLKVATHHTSNY